MFTFKIFAIFGIVYLFIGLTNVEIDYIDNLYKNIWGVSKPTKNEIVWLGFMSILAEIILDLTVNIIFY